MFEKEAKEEINKEHWNYSVFKDLAQEYWQKGADFGYNKALEEVKHDLMMKLKDEGIVKPLKDSIFRNERLSSQEQQELCAWIECAMGFGENLDECAKELTEAKDIIKELVKGVRITFDHKGFITDVDAFVSKAEQFLKEVEI